MCKNFVSDFEVTDEEYAVLVRGFNVGSKILNINTPELPKGFAFFSAKDLPNKNHIRFLNEKIPIFAENQIEYKGQPIGILTGADKQELLKLASLFQIETIKTEEVDSEENTESKNEKLNPNTDSEGAATQDNRDEQPENPKAISSEDIRLQETEKSSKAENADIELQSKTLLEQHIYKDTSVAAMQMINSGNAEEVFAKTENIISSSFSFKQRYHFHAEPACVKAVWNKNTLEIHAATQWPFNILNSVCDVLNIDKDKVNVVLHKEAESLDGRLWFPTLVSVQAAIASYLTKKNICLQFSRQEDFLYTTKSPEVSIKYKSAVSSSGKIEAVSVSILMDVGSYNPFINDILRQMVLTAAGIYRIPVYTINAVAVRSQNGLTGPLAGWGDSYVTAALENHINEIAEHLNLSPVDFRMDNVLKIKEEKIYGEKKEENFKFKNLFDTVCSESDFFRRYYSYRSLNKARQIRHDGTWRGIGIASGLQYSGSNILVKSGMNYSAEITLTKENEVIVKAEPTSSGVKRILKSEIAKELETEESKVIFLGGSTNDMSPTGAATASCGISIIPDLIGKCCEGIKKQKFRKPLPITVTKTYKVSRTKDWSNEFLKGVPFISTTPGVCVVELELNPGTYEVKTKGIWLACNPGKVYSKKTVMRNIHKSISNALSGISIERIREENSSFQFKIIPANEIPPIKVFLLDSELKPFALNELAAGLVPAAYVSALNQIMINYKKIDSVPVFPEDIFKLFIKNEVEDEN